MLIQLPFLFAYYKMLATALDLRHAHWLWIHDLSAADPLYLLPIFMVVSMLVTQKMTPQAGMDPSQQKMMTVMMPLMMGFIFFRLAGGSEFVLCREQSDFDRAAGRDEPHGPRPRDARNDGEARAEEG